jgi:hypothetical protein
MGILVRLLSGERRIMSWDAVLLRVGEGVASVEEMGEEALPLGKRKEVIDAIRSVFPGVETRTAARLLYRAGDLSMEFVLQGKRSVDSVTVEVRGEGDPVTPLLQLAEGNGWVVLDGSTSEFIDPERPGENGFEGYRKMVRGVERTKKPKK